MGLSKKFETHRQIIRRKLITSGAADYLTEHVYPVLKERCKAIGLEFEVIDLRWGVRNEATNDHQTIDICLGELQRCFANSTSVAFVYIAGERYGWRALPNKVECDELDELLAHVESWAAMHGIS